MRRERGASRSPTARCLSAWPSNCAGCNGKAMNGSAPTGTWERSWAAELERRIAENKPGIPGDQVFAELRARLQNRRKSG